MIKELRNIAPRNSFHLESKPCILSSEIIKREIDIINIERNKDYKNV
jgi:hypothetical protein